MTQRPDLYSAEPKIHWYRSPIDDQALQQLMQRSNWRGWLQTIMHLGWFFCTAALAYLAFLNVSTDNWTWSLPLLAAALFLHGTMGPFMGLIAIHELQHRTVFKSRKLNVAFERIYAFISWSDYIWYQQSHVRHHQSTCNQPFDGEVVLPLKVKMSGWRFWLSLLGWYAPVTLAKLLLTMEHAKGNLHGEWYAEVLPKENQSLRKTHQNWARTLLLGHGILAAIFIMSGHYFLLLVFTFGTQYCSWLGFLCGATQHYGLQANVDDFRLNTRTFTCSALVGFYYWNMQYHLEHHMYPAVPFHKLPALHAAVKHDLPKATHGLLNTWRQILSIRRQTLTDRGYAYHPEIPHTNAPKS